MKYKKKSKDFDKYLKEIYVFLRRYGKRFVEKTLIETSNKYLP